MIGWPEPAEHDGVHVYALAKSGSDLDGASIYFSAFEGRAVADAKARAHADRCDAAVYYVGKAVNIESERSRRFYPAMELELLPDWARTWVADQEERAGKVERKSRPGTTKALIEAYGPSARGRRRRSA